SHPARQLNVLIDAFANRMPDGDVFAVAFDDYHVIATSPLAERFIHDLFVSLPARLVVCSRVRPSWVTARSQVYGEVCELGPELLALSSDETTAVLKGIDARVTAHLLAQANGWPAVIGLAAAAEPMRGARGVNLSTTLFRFFAEE